MKIATKMCAVSLMATTLLSPAASAAIVSNLYDINIDGTLYDVTFYNDREYSFNELWDANGDGVYGNDSSVLNRAPTFWGDGDAAALAAIAVIEALGTEHGVINDTDDRFFVPYNARDGGTDIDAAIEEHEDLQFDQHDAEIFNRSGPPSLSGAYASFRFDNPPPPVLLPGADAAVINNILGLDIGGTLYDVTFHNDRLYTFNELWDADGDGVYGNDDSLLNRAPIFLGDTDATIQAVNAITKILGTEYGVSNETDDAFFVPYERVFSTFHNRFLIDGIREEHGDLLNDGWDTGTFFADGLPDVAGTYASLSIAAAPAPVPIPASLMLFGSGLIGLIGIAKRKTQS